MNEDDVHTARGIMGKIPGSWSVLALGREVSVYDGPKAVEASTVLHLSPEDGSELWTATLLERDATGVLVPCDDVTGVVERCVEWAAERADERSGGDGR